MPSPEPIPGRCGAKVLAKVWLGEDRPAGFCTRWPMTGGKRCPSHGGKAKQVKAAAAVRDVEARAAKAVARYEPEPLTAGTAVEKLERVIGLTVQKAEWFNGELDRLMADNDLAVVTASQGEQLRAVALASERWLKEARAALSDWVRLGMDQRRIDLDRAKLALEFEAFTAVLEGAMTDMGMSEAQQLEFRAAIGRRLRDAL